MDFKKLEKLSNKFAQLVQPLKNDESSQETSEDVIATLNEEGVTDRCRNALLDIVDQLEDEKNKDKKEEEEEEFEKIGYYSVDAMIACNISGPGKTKATVDFIVSPHSNTEKTNPNLEVNKIIVQRANARLAAKYSSEASKVLSRKLKTKGQLQRKKWFEQPQ